jgi:hypothetical protein
VRDCGLALPAGSRSSRKYCRAACRSEQWRKLKRSGELYAAAVEELAAAGLRRGPTGAEMRAAQPSARCPVCGRTWWVSLQKRSDAKYGSHKCRSAAWRERRGQTPKWLADLRARSDVRRSQTVPEIWAGMDIGEEHHRGVVIDAQGGRVLSRRVLNNETALLQPISAVLALCENTLSGG